MIINFVQQPTDITCTSACLAMLTGKSIDLVIGESHEGWCNNSTDPVNYLLKYGINLIINTKPFKRTMEWGFVYLLTVPSLNVEGGLHHIVVDLTTENGTVLDPNRGRHGKEYYINWVDTPNSQLEVPLKSFTIDLVIEP